MDRLSDIRFLEGGMITYLSSCRIGPASQSESQQGCGQGSSLFCRGRSSQAGTRFSKLEKCVYPGRKNHNILNEALQLACSQLNYKSKLKALVDGE